MNRIFLGVSITMIALSAVVLPHPAAPSDPSTPAQPDTFKPLNERPRLSGHWSAIVHRDGEEHRIEVDLDVIESRWVGEFDVPSFGLENYPVDVALSDSAVHLHFSAVDVDFRGQLSSEADSLIGIALRDGQGEEPFEIAFHRTGPASFSEMFLALEKAAEDSTAVRVLSGLEDLKAAFNRDVAKVRLLMLLAPS